MFRVRGKPDEPLNVKIAEQHMHLSDAIHVNPLHQISGTRPNESPNKQREILRRRQHFDEFRETYQDRLQKYQKKAGQEEETTTKTSGFSIKRFFGDSPRNAAGNEHKPVYVRAPLKAMKTVTVEIPLVAKQNAVWCPGGLTSTSTMNTVQKSKVDNVKKPDVTIKKPVLKKPSDLLEKLKELEKSIKTVDRKESGAQAEIFKEIEDVNEEIDIAALQLQHIKSIIQNKKVTTMKSNQNDNENPQCEKSSTTWMVENGPNKKSEDASGAKRLATTLNILNKRLQAMQDKFKSKSAYKSIRDYLSARQSVHVLYKNNNFKSKSKLKGLFPEAESDPVMEIIKNHQDVKCGRPCSPVLECNYNVIRATSPKKIETKNTKSPRKKNCPPPADTDEEDEMGAFLDVELLKSVMRSQFLSKEFREGVRGGNEKIMKMKKRRVQFPTENAVFSSADLVRS